MSLPWKKEYKEFKEGLKEIRKVQKTSENLKPPPTGCSQLKTQSKPQPKAPLKTLLKPQTKTQFKKAKTNSVAKGLQKKVEKQKNPHYTIAAILPKSKKTIENFREKWDKQLSTRANIDLNKMSTEDKDYILATLAYEERLFGAIGIINGYKQRIPNFPEHGFTITAGELEKGTGANTSIYRIKFNPSESTKAKNLTGKKVGWLQSSRMDNLPIVAEHAAHEYGHVIDYAITCQLYDKFYPGEENHPFDKKNFNMLFFLVARVRAEKLKKAVKEESGTKLKDSRILENDPNMIKGVSGYAKSKPADFWAENMIRVTLSEKDPDGDILAKKARAYMDQGLSGMAQDIEQTIKDEKLFEAHKNYYSKGFTGKLKAYNVTPALLKSLDPNYSDLIGYAIRTHCRFALENLRKAVAECKDQMLSTRFSQLATDLMSVKTYENPFSAINEFMDSKPYKQHADKPLSEKDKKLKEYTLELNHALEVALNAIKQKISTTLNSAITVPDATGKLENLNKRLITLHRLSKESYQENYQSSKEAIQKNKYMEELQKTGDNLTADAISLKHLYYATKHKRPEDLTQVILKECDNEVTPAHTPPKTIEKKAIKKGF